MPTLETSVEKLLLFAKKAATAVNKTLIIGAPNRIYDLERASYFVLEAYNKVNDKNYYSHKINNKSMFFPIYNTPKDSETYSSEFEGKVIQHAICGAETAYLNKVGYCDEMSELAAYFILKENKAIDVSFMNIYVNRHYILHTFLLLSDGSNTVICDPWLNYYSKLESGIEAMLAKIYANYLELSPYLLKELSSLVKDLISCLYSDDHIQNVSFFIIKLLNNNINMDIKSVKKLLCSITDEKINKLKQIFPQDFDDFTHLYEHLSQDTDIFNLFAPRLMYYDLILEQLSILENLETKQPYVNTLTTFQLSTAEAKQKYINQFEECINKELDFRTPPSLRAKFPRELQHVDSNDNNSNHSLDV